MENNYLFKIIQKLSVAEYSLIFISTSATKARVIYLNDLEQ